MGCHGSLCFLFFTFSQLCSVFISSVCVEFLACFLLLWAVFNDLHIFTMFVSVQVVQSVLFVSGCFSFVVISANSS